jgi:hypothetical protein
VARRCWPRGVTRRRPHRERVARLRPSGLSTFFPVAQPFCELLYLFLSHFLILVYRNFEEIQIQFFIFYFFRKFTMCNLPYLFINYSPIVTSRFEEIERERVRQVRMIPLRKIYRLGGDCVPWRMCTIEVNTIVSRSICHWLV